MANLDFEVTIPFVENSGRRCVPACMGMILATLMPERRFSQAGVEHLSGWASDKSTWAAQHLLSLHALGVEVGWIQDEDLAAFGHEPEDFMRHQFQDEMAYSLFATKNNLTQEARRIKTYLGLGLPFEQRPATQADITNRLTSGWLVRLEVNGMTLADQDGYAAHAVMVSGFNDSVVRLENPDGRYGSKPGQLVSWERLHEAWDEPTMQYYRRGGVVEQ